LLTIYLPYCDFCRLSFPNKYEFIYLFKDTEDTVQCQNGRSCKKFVSERYARESSTSRAPDTRTLSR